MTPLLRPAKPVTINPLRVLDDKREDVQRQLVDAPLMPDHLCQECATHHEAVLGYLDAMGIDYEKAPRLVRVRWPESSRTA